MSTIRTVETINTRVGRFQRIINYQAITIPRVKPKLSIPAITIYTLPVANAGPAIFEDVVGVIAI